MPPIEHRGKLFRFDTYENGKRGKQVFSSYEECLAAWEQYKSRRKKTGTGEPELLSIKEEYNTEQLWEMVTENQSTNRRDVPTLMLPNEPFALAFLSDLHIGSAETDHMAIRNDAEIVANTDGMYAIFHGDGIDNWIVPKLTGKQRSQAVPFDIEVALLKAWLTTLGSKLIAVVAGNHDNWTYKMSGIDYLESITPPNAVYNQHQGFIDVQWDNKTLRLCIRHSWKGYSMYNPTHAMERASKEVDADVYVGGHTHIGTLFRSFTVRGRDRLAVITGTYKMQDGYGVELGLPAPAHRGCGAVVVDIDGSMVWFRELAPAQKYLKFLRSYQKGE
jgi:predicted phosphodiesterase